mmetsp:Transcript_6122/g.7764  ORF Transcript_6122/g.7764 Transcript_6122/m.7764 type:complete len:246 (-) Transcript_6122:105-842(-)
MKSTILSKFSFALFLCYSYNLYNAFSPSNHKNVHFAEAFAFTSTATPMRRSFISSKTRISMAPIRPKSTGKPSTFPMNMSTTTAPPREKTDRKTNSNTNNNQDDERSRDPDDIVRYNDAPLEYLEDEWSTRNPDDPYHILLLDTTFTKNDKITIPYVAGCVTYVLGMPDEEAKDLTNMAFLNGFSCLGTWEREECLKYGRELQIRDCVVRVVPFCEGGSRGWQAKDASASGSSKSSSSNSNSSFQ